MFFLQALEPPEKTESETSAGNASSEHTAAYSSVSNIIAPKVAPKLLPRNMAQAAIDCDLSSGRLVPITETGRVADLAADLGLPLVVGARPGLGTINHTLLTVEVARSRGLDLLGIIINGLDADAAGVAEETNPAELAREAQLPILTVVPYDGETDPREPYLGPAVVEACMAVDFRRLLRL